METPNLKISLKETGIYSTYDRFYATFRNRKISTVADILNDELMYDILRKVSIKTRKELECFISLIKYKYQGIPIVGDSFLEHPLSFQIKSSGFIEIPELDSLGFNTSKNGRLRYLIDYAFKNNMINPKTTFINCFKLFTSDERIMNALNSLSVKEENTRFLAIIQIYVEYYEEKQKLTGDEVNTIRILKSQLMGLINMRDTLDSEITKLETETNELMNKGEIRK